MFMSMYDIIHTILVDYIMMTYSHHVMKWLEKPLKIGKTVKFFLVQVELWRLQNFNTTCRSSEYSCMDGLI